MSNYKTKTIKDEMNIWKNKEAEKAAAATIRFNNIAARKAKIAARRADKEQTPQDAGQQMRLF